MELSRARVVHRPRGRRTSSSKRSVCSPATRISLSRSATCTRRRTIWRKPCRSWRS